jgi:hypothetical protein
MIQVNVLLPLAGRSPNSFVMNDLMRLPLGYGVYRRGRDCAPGRSGSGCHHGGNALAANSNRLMLWQQAGALGGAGAALGVLVRRKVRPCHSRSAFAGPRRPLYRGRSRSASRLCVQQQFRDALPDRLGHVEWQRLGRDEHDSTVARAMGRTAVVMTAAALDAPLMVRGGLYRGRHGGRYLRWSDTRNRDSTPHRGRIGSEGAGIVFELSTGPFPSGPAARRPGGTWTIWQLLRSRRTRMPSASHP